MNDPKIVFVSGADGMLGSNVVRELLRQNYAVRAMVQPGRDPKTLKDLPKVEIVYADLLEKEKLAASMEGCEAAIHIAAYAATNPARSEAFFKVNVEGTKNMVYGAQKHNLKRYVQISSSNSLGSTEDKATGGNEETPWPGDLGFDYNLTKRLAHEYVMDKFKNEGFPVVAICPTFMIGEYDSGPSSGMLLVKHYENPLLFYTDGGKNFVAARDVASATVNALEKGRLGESYLCGNQNLEFREFLNLLSEVANKRKPVAKMPSGIAIGFAAVAEGAAKLIGQKPLLTPAMVRNASAKMYFDPSKARKELDMPQTDLKVAVQDAYNWFFENGYLKPNK